MRNYRLCQSRSISRLFAKCGLTVAIGLLLFPACPMVAATGSGPGLHTIDNPGGGQVVYGPMTKITTLPEAMGAMLRNVHGHFGDRPQIGQLVQSKQGGSLATFFTLIDKNGKGEKIAGMAIVVVPKGSSGAAAVLYDHADRFGKTQPVLLNKLNQAWKQQSPAHVASASTSQSSAPAQPSPGQSSPAPRQNYPVQALHTAANGDNSASVGIPAGWQVIGGGGGSIQAKSASGDGISLAEHVQNIYDPNNPQARSMINYLSKGSTPFFACSPSNLVAAFQCLEQQGNRRQHKPEPTLSDIRSQRMPTDGSMAQAIQIAYIIDHHDGKGPKHAYAELGQTRELPNGGWSVYISSMEAPLQIASQDWPTLRAAWTSFRANGRVIHSELVRTLAIRDAQSVANTARMNAQSQQHDAMNKAIYDRSKANDAYNHGLDSQRDEQDWQSKIFQNYTLDQTVVRTSDDAYHIHTDYPTAATLVQSNPNAFEYVPNQQLMKGVDF